jgi:hypothetical protein
MPLGRTLTQLVLISIEQSLRQVMDLKLNLRAWASKI